jgi:hypothetical protein
MSSKQKMVAQKAAVEMAIKAIGLGYDLTEDLNLKYCKRSSAEPRLIVIDDDQVRDLVVPGRISVRNVPKSIKCDKGERLRFASDVLSFQQVWPITRDSIFLFFIFFIFGFLKLISGEGVLGGLIFCKFFLVIRSSVFVCFIFV